VASIGYPGPVLRAGRLRNLYNLGSGWVGFDFGAALGCPVKVVNDAAMQALGSYKGGQMLFLGLGTGLGSTMIVAEPMELGHLPYKKGTYEDYVGRVVGSVFGQPRSRCLGGFGRVYRRVSRLSRLFQAPSLSGRYSHEHHDHPEEYCFTGINSPTDDRRPGAGKDLGN